VQDTASTAYDLHFAPAGHQTVASKVSKRTHTKKKHKSKSTATFKTRGTTTARTAVVSPFRQQGVSGDDRSGESASDSTTAAPCHEVSHPVNAQGVSVAGCDSCAPSAAEQGPPSPEPVTVPLDSLLPASQCATRSMRWDCEITHNNCPMVLCLLTKLVTTMCRREAAAAAPPDGCGHPDTVPAVGLSKRSVPLFTRKSGHSAQANVPTPTQDSNFGASGAANVVSPPKKRGRPRKVPPAVVQCARPRCSGNSDSDQSSTSDSDSDSDFKLRTPQRTVYEKAAIPQLRTKSCRGTRTLR
jgi:hypothetical protein